MRSVLTGIAGFKHRRIAPPGHSTDRCKELLQSIDHTGESIEIKGHSIQPRRRFAREPFGDALRAQRIGAEDIDEPEIAQPLGADRLFATRRDPRNNQGRFAEREDLADAVVAAHRNDPIGADEQRQRLLDEANHAKPPLASGDLM
jgi:hypothetical protein